MGNGSIQNPMTAWCIATRIPSRSLPSGTYKWGKKFILHPTICAKIVVAEFEIMKLVRFSEIMDLSNNIRRVGSFPLQTWDFVSMSGTRTNKISMTMKPMDDIVYILTEWIGDDYARL